MVTTNFQRDYLGRELTNDTPGTSDATGYLGRDVQAGDLDWLGRPLTDEASGE